MKKNKAEKIAKLIQTDLNYLYANQNILQVIVNKSYEINNSTIIGYEHYLDDFIELVENNKFNIKLNDDSLIVLSYIFDSSGDISKYSLSFLPSIKDTDSDIYECLGKYCRIDYDPTCNNKVNHPILHYHNCIHKNSIRMQIEYDVFPSEFLYIVLKYIMGTNINLDFLEKHITTTIEKERCRRNSNYNNHFILKLF